MEAWTGSFWGNNTVRAQRLTSWKRAGRLGPLVAAAIGVGVVVSAILVLDAQGSADEIVRGQIVYETACASCHGAKLEGQANWKSPNEDGRMPAPPHDASGHTWHHTDEVIFGIIKFGLKPYAGEDYESDMQPFEGILSDAEIASVISYIKGTWPEKQRFYQEEITRRAE